MTTPENPFSHSDDRIPRVETHDTADIEPDALLLGKLYELKDSLEKKREPDLQTHYFQFDQKTIRDTVVLPKPVTDLITQGDELSLVDLRCTRLGESPQTEMTFEITFVFENEATNKEKVLTVFRPYNYLYSKENRDVLTISELDEDDSSGFDGELGEVEGPTEQIPAVDPREFNRFVSSLLYPHAKDLSVFDDFDWQYDRLTKRLATIASTSGGECFYNLDATDGGFSGKLSYDFEGDEVTEFCIERTILNDIAVSVTGDIDYAVFKLRTIINGFDDPVAIFWYHQEIAGKPMNKIIANSDADYGTLFRFIDQSIPGTQQA